MLDPACGSGNFLYLALHALKDIEHRAALEAETLGLPLGFAGFHTGPHNVMGIELNSYAAELARVTVWIGELQWMLRHGMSPSKNPILKPLEHIACRDALLNEDGSEAQWPTVDVIIGNPPFLGGTKKRGELGNAYFEALARVYDERVSPGADLVCYWFQKAQEQIEHGHCYRAGLVATNSIRQQANRKVLDQIVKNGRIFEAWSDEPWINEGAAVRVSIVCFGAGNVAQIPNEIKVKLDGRSVTEIHANLRSGDNLTTAVRLPENGDASFFGLALAGSFSIEQDQALEWLSLPNPNGRPCSDVVRPLWNGQDLTGRWDGRWVVDFGQTMSEDEAMLYEAPFQHVLKYVKPVRILNNRKSRAEKWWRHGEARPAMRKALSGLGRYIATSEKSKHRFFVWLNEQIAPDNRLVVVARNDDATFGMLSSRIHVCWALAVGSTLEDRPAYATTTCFETFPFPEGLTPNLKPANYTNSAATKIAAAAQKLNELRNNWLNPPEWTDWVRTAEEEKAGYPARPVAKPGFEADLKKRTLTNLYNVRPAWLDNAHKALDAAVAKAYGWNDYTPEMNDDEILRRLLALNLARSRL